MNTQRQLLGLAIAGILGSSALLFGSDALAEAASKDTTATAAVAAASQDADESSLIRTVDEAYTALREIRGARMAIFDGTPEAAVKLADEAHKHLVTARDNMNDYRLMTSKKAADGEAYIPFDTSMALAEGFVPDEAKRAAMTKANEHLAKGEKSHAVDALKLGNIDVSVSAAMIPATASVAHLDDAVKLLGEKRYYEANLALKAVEDSVIVETYGLDALPAQGADAKG